MKLTHICIVTENLPGLRDFYQKILQLQPEQFKNDYVEFGTEGAILSLFELKSHEALAPKSMISGANRSIELEFQVEDVDIEYARLNGLQGASSGSWLQRLCLGEIEAYIFVIQMAI